MPILEAPAGFVDSTPERSISPALGNNPEVQNRHSPPFIHIHVQTPEPQREQTHRSRHLPQQSSFDRDISANEEDNHWPNAAVHLLPVTLPPRPTEPTLDELLQQRVTERNDLQNVESIRLRVISYTISLSRLSIFLPRLQHLNLSGSVLCSLRDLGYGLLYLSHLNVSNCGLNSFDGISGFSALREVIADGNMIQRVGPLAELPLLHQLSAQNNRISELGLLSFLGLCPNLVDLHLQGNPVCHLTLYRTTLQRSVPSLALLDGVALNIISAVQTPERHETQQHNNNNNVSTDGDSELSSLSSERQMYVLSSSSLSSEVEPDLTKTLPVSSGVLDVTRFNRPATAPTTAQNMNRAPIIRPGSEQSHNRILNLNQGAIVVGSVLSIVRRARRRVAGSAWASTNSSSDSTSISESEPVFPSTNQPQVSLISNCSSPDISSSSGV